VNEQPVTPAVLRVAQALIASGFAPGVTEDPPASDDERPPYKVPEAARLLKVHESTLYRAIQTGSLSAYSVGESGRAIRIPAAELDAFKVRRMIRAARTRTRTRAVPSLGAAHASAEAVA
jgi:excisionase family DNA binding protein